MSGRPYRLPRQRLTASLSRFAVLTFAVFLTAGFIYGAGAVIVNGLPSVRLPSTADRPSTPAATVEIVIATPPPTPEPTATPSPTPSPTPSIAATRYRSGGRNYVGLEVPADTELLARFDGVVEVRIYQFFSGQVWIGSNEASLPFFPYVTVISGDRRMTYRLGALGSDTELLVRDGQRVAMGDSLFRVTGEGRSSWATFYDPRVPFQVVVSLQAIPSGRDLDALVYFVDQ